MISRLSTLLLAMGNAGRLPDRIHATHVALICNSLPTTWRRRKVPSLNDKAAGIWISWTLRKITGETMGTDKRKWGDWWKSEKLRHPELFDDPDERPGGSGGPPVVTGGGGKSK